MIVSTGFWNEAILGKFAEDCVYHVIVPTIFQTKCHDGVTDRDKINEDAFSDMRHCVECKAYLGGKMVHVCMRWVLGKRNAHSTADGSAAYIYRTGVAQAHMCMDCSNKLTIIIGLDSNSAMHNYFLDQIEDVSRSLQFSLLKTEFDGQRYLRTVLDIIDANQSAILRAIGKADTESKCPHCASAGPKMICGGCRLVRYCNKSCQRKDWCKHKPECNYLQTNSLYFWNLRIEK